MKLTIINKNENSLLGRKELKGVVDFEAATSSNKEVTEALAKELGVAGELIIVKHIYTKYSSQKADFFAYVYNSAEDRKKIELQKKPKKEGEKKAEEAPASKKGGK